MQAEKTITVLLTKEQVAIIMTALEEYQQDFEVFLHGMEISNKQSITDLADMVTACEETNEARKKIETAAKYYKQ